MERREFIKFAGISLVSLLAGCNPFEQPPIKEESTPNLHFPSSPFPSPASSPPLTTSRQAENDKDGVKEVRPGREKEPQRIKNALEVLMASPITEADRLRAERQRNDPEWKERVNPKLSRFYSFALFGYGETNEPGPKGRTPPGVIIGSYSIFTYDLLTSQLYKLSISHDFHSPEIAKKKYNNPREVNLLTRISEAHANGGFILMRQVLENIFGLSMDFQVAVSDKLIVALIDEVRQGIEVEIPYEDGVLLYPYYIDGKLQPPNVDHWSLSKGKHKIDGKTAVGLIKSVPIPRFPGDYEKTKEHHVREDLVLAGLKKDFFTQLVSDPLLNVRLSNFLANLPSRKDLIDYDFDWQKVVLGNLSGTFSKFSQLVSQGSSNALAIPDFTKSAYFADDNSGVGGGLRYNDDTFVPPGFNFEGDVRKNYWKAFRDYTEKLLLE